MIKIAKPKSDIEIDKKIDTAILNWLQNNNIRIETDGKAYRELILTVKGIVQENNATVNKEILLTKSIPTEPGNYLCLRTDYERYPENIVISLEKDGSLTFSSKNSVFPLSNLEKTALFSEKLNIHVNKNTPLKTKRRKN